MYKSKPIRAYVCLFAVNQRVSSLTCYELLSDLRVISREVKYPCSHVLLYPHNVYRSGQKRVHIRQILPDDAIHRNELNQRFLLYVGLSKWEAWTDGTYCCTSNHHTLLQRFDEENSSRWREYNTLLLPACLVRRGTKGKAKRRSLLWCRLV